MFNIETDKYVNKMSIVKMFVVLYVKEGICYFEAPGIDKYTQVTLVEVTSLEEATKKVVDNTDDSESEDIDVDDQIDEL